MARNVTTPAKIAPHEILPFGDVAAGGADEGFLCAVIVWVGLCFYIVGVCAGI